ncbi:uncharacterized protein FA14DRAFT_121883 [Meira miltonrushii]|uniref:RRM domain-containing protein n=1 Tax=Meira miltonrushii TaxID=1280837 RepID=A0A316VF59_9BASI|nr:uncharacterized protein FA14DRAFT_121883 [Meira miltonrushii]PWN36170.1 hypothetical protein FA14DRAFT_121883 [Meira miltonrushii]
MTEREFANMFLFAKGFEASTLKIPAGMNTAPLRPGENASGIMGPPGKIKQIIGFAKFRTRAEALEARDALNGRKIDAERGCVLKTEMAKKNLHTKQRPVLATAPGQEGQSSMHFRATSPGSPPISSPTSRSFSIDANPPGNTLFVGNLPASITSPPNSTQLEDALYKVFSVKNGFRQMSFRVKSSGPMCFIEFEDVGCAGRALGELNGDTLDGMVKGGLRLSFSKHPLFKGTSSASSHGGQQTPVSANHATFMAGQPAGSGASLPNNEQISNAVRAARVASPGR